MDRAFAELLKEYRLAAGLTQEALAERAGVSSRSIQALERGENRPQQETARRLAEALALDERDRARLLRAVTPIPRRRMAVGATTGPAEQATAPVPSPPETAPSDGMLTVLVADVRGYTAFTHLHGDAAGAALATRFAALAGEAVAAEAGRVVEVRGDEVLAVFTSARAALRAATSLQTCCAQEASAALPLHAGVGLDVGEPVSVEGGYRGEAINVAARLCAQAGPGEVLASEAVVHLARRVEGLAYQERGELALKGLPRPVRTWIIRAGSGEMEPTETPASGTPVVTAVPVATVRHNLSDALSSFIGREHERAAVSALLAEARLVTLVGSGGVGKSRLALAAAGDLLDQYRDGVWLVELAALAEPGLVPGAVAQALGVREEMDRPLTATLADHLKQKQSLLVLDNCEHLVTACAALAGALLRACPHLRILATSREGLEIAGEHRYRVPSLSVPDRKHLPPPELTESYEAVRLFVARARERRADFVVTEANAQAVAQVCVRLDGIPLAIELAAARVGSLPVREIATRLDERFRLLSGGARDLPPRQRTLRATLDWGWDLLEEQERVLLGWLSVFAGGWTLAGAEAVFDAMAGPAPWTVLDGLDALVNKSLVQVDESGEEAGRYRLLDTVRAYAAERLAGSGDEAQARDRHLAHFLALAEETAPRLTGAAQRALLERLEIEHENLRAAVRWAHGCCNTTALLRLAAALWRFWYLRGYLSEGRAWLESALSLAADDAAGEPRASAMAHHGAGVLTWTQGDHARATALAEGALDRWLTLGDTAGMASTLNLLGLVAIDQGDWSRAAVALEKSLALRRAGEDCWGIATALHNLGTVARRQGDPVRAAALYDESLALRRALDDAAGLAISSKDRGMLAVEQGDAARAVASFREGLALAASLGDTVRIAECLEGLAAVAAQQGRAAPATELLAAAAAQRERVHAPIAPADEADHARLQAALRADLGVAFDAAWAEGRALPLEEAIALALEGAAGASDRE